MDKRASLSFAFLFGAVWIVAIVIYRMPSRLEHRLEKDARLRGHIQALTIKLLDLNQATGQAQWLPEDPSLPDVARNLGAKRFTVTTQGGAFPVMQIEIPGRDTIIVFPERKIYM